MSLLELPRSLALFAAASLLGPMLPTRALAAADALIIPIDADCIQPIAHEAELVASEGMLDVTVRLSHRPAPGAAGEAVLVMPATGASVEASLDGVPLHLDFLTGADASALLLELAEGRGDPSVLELAGKDLLVARLPGGDADEPAPRVVTIHERSALVAEAGVARISHRLRPGWTWCSPAEHVSIRIDLGPIDGRPVAVAFAPYHDLQSTRSEAGNVVLTSEEWGQRPAFDLELIAATAEGLVGAALMSYREPACDGALGNEDAHFVLVAAPNPDHEAETSLPKDIVLVMDTSGSMSGDKILQAREAMAYVLRNLNEGDRFNVIDFDGNVQTLFGGLTANTPSALEDALAFVAAMSAEGSTNIHDALVAALEQFPAGDGRPDFVVFATDGQPTEGVTERDAILAATKAANRQEARVFPFGIGHDVNTFLLDGLAAQNFGVSSYIRPGADIATALAAFYERIRAPLMAGLSLRARGVSLSEVHPGALPDLFRGGEVLAVGRHGDAEAGSIALDGDLDGDGIAETVEPKGLLARTATTHRFAPRLWAARAIADLIARDRAAPGDDAVEDRIRSLARRFGMVTPFTHFFVDEDGNVQGDYSRPTDEESGERSVAHSRGVNDMNANDNAGAYGGDDSVAGMIRHLDDRTFIVEEGYWTDTSVDPAVEPLELTWMGPAYRRFLAADPSLGRYLSMGRNIVFRHGCETFRVTDPALADEEVVEGQEPREVPEETGLSPSEVLAASPAADIWMPPVAMARDGRDPVPVPVRGEDPPEAVGEQYEGSKALCAVHDPDAVPGPGALLILLALAAMVRRRWIETTSQSSMSGTARSSSDGRPRS